VNFRSTGIGRYSPSSTAEPRLLVKKRLRDFDYRSGDKSIARGRGMDAVTI